MTEEQDFFGSEETKLAADTDDDWDDIDLEGIESEDDEADIEEAQLQGMSEGTKEAAGMPPQAEAVKNDEVVRVTLNGVPVELPIKEAEQLIGRGQNWKELAKERDALSARVKEAESSGAYLNELARQSGMSVPEYIRMSRIKAYMNAGMNEASARALISNEERIMRDRADAEAYRSQQRAQQDIAARKKNDLIDFVAAFPDLKPESIPEKVWKDTENGMSITNAWLNYQLAAMRAENEQLKQRNENVLRTTGSVATSVMKQKSDPFLEGFLEG